MANQTLQDILTQQGRFNTSEDAGNTYQNMFGRSAISGAYNVDPGIMQSVEQAFAALSPQQQTQVAPLLYKYAGDPVMLQSFAQAVASGADPMPVLNARAQWNDQNLAASNAANSSSMLQDLTHPPGFVLGALGLMGAGALGAFGGGAGAAAGAGGFAAADAAGLAQMAADAGLTGAAADAFVASGGALGSTAAGAGAATGLPSNYWNMLANSGGTLSDIPAELYNPFNDYVGFPPDITTPGNEILSAPSGTTPASLPTITPSYVDQAIGPYTTGTNAAGVPLTPVLDAAGSVSGTSIPRIPSVPGTAGNTGPGTNTSGTSSFLNLIPSLIGAGSGLNTMFNSSPAVDPNMVNALWQAGQNTYNTALDPQGALYKRTQQQLQEQTRAAQSARGLAMSPYAAGIENKAMSDFNIDWQNQQLNRQIAGTGAFSGAGNVAANAGIANNAQAFMQNQTGLNNLTTALTGTPGGMTYNPSTGQWTQAGGNPGLINAAGSWLSNVWGNGNGWGGAPQLAAGSTPTGGFNMDYFGAGV